MSAAANNWLKDRPLLTVLFSFIGSLILAFTMRAVNMSDEKAREFEDKLDKKADTEWVRTKLKEEMSQHEAKEQIMLNRLENIITLSLEKQEAVVKSIDKRLERIENNQR